MNELLQPGQQVHGVHTGIAFRTDAYLGGGSQGEVYRAVTVTAPEEPVAVKWFYPRYVRQDIRLRERLDRAVQLGPPSDAFLWPQDLVTSSTDGGFGYVMALREPRFHGMAELVTRQIEPSFRALATAGYELANAFLRLHSSGLSYRDISFGNVFFDPATGHVQICDNDNVDIDGQPGSVGGTVRFMAPELVTGVGRPNTETDLFSLAVLLFYLLMNHHPLEGAREAQIHCFDLPAMTRLYGSEAVFIFDPHDESNRPVPGLHDNALAFWPLYPTYLRRFFTRSFVDGASDAQARVRESEWRSALARLRDFIFPCTSCGAENFYDPDSVEHASRSSGTENHCWYCTQPLRLPARMRVHQGNETQVVMLPAGAELFPHHVERAKSFSFDEPVAQVRPHPKRAGVYGLANLSATEWTVTTAASETLRVSPGRSITLKNGVRIQFGTSEGEIRI